MKRAENYEWILGELDQWSDEEVEAAAASPTFFKTTVRHMARGLKDTVSEASRANVSDGLGRPLDPSSGGPWANA